jgi:hypothetical protein
MWIVLDTNIYFNNWFASSPNFKMLLNFCNNRRCTLLLPEIAIKEVNNKYAQAREKLLITYESTLRELSKLGVELSNDRRVIEEKNYDIGVTLREMANNVEFVSFDAVSHALLVEKALKPKLPFRENEKGYRDSLFWVSILDHIRSRNYTGDVVFLNQNSKDFYSERGGERCLHADLQEDIARLDVTANFILHESIKSFLDSQESGYAHDIDWGAFYEQHNGTLDSAAGEEAVNHLDTLPLEDVKHLLSIAGYDQRMLDAAFEVSFEDWEGVEDSEIVNMRKVQADSIEVFVDYKFDFRILDVKLLMTHSHYYSDKYYIDSQGDADFSEDIVEVRLLARADLTASIIFNPEDDLVSNVEINDIRFRKVR